MITYDSNFVITVTRQNAQSHWIRAYDINNRKTHFEEQVKGKVVQLKSIEQNDAGDTFGVAYVDDGTFRIRTFNIHITHDK